MARKITQASLILKSLDSKSVGGLYELSKKEELLGPLADVMQYIKNLDMKKILDNAGGVNSLDTMIDRAVDQSFSRGRISAMVLLYTLIKNAEKEMEKRERRK
jgi:hypothetical protein